jgi:hypothetical protein
MRRGNPIIRDREKKTIPVGITLLFPNPRGNCVLAPEQVIVV